MNLHAIAAGAIGAVNPFVLGTVRRSTGYTTAADGKRVATYADTASVAMQWQALQYSDILKLGALNIQGVRQAVYLNGHWDGLVRRDGKGGDLIVLDGQSWLVAMVLENWPDWSKVAVSLQVD